MLKLIGLLLVYVLFYCFASGIAERFGDFTEKDKGTKSYNLFLLLAAVMTAYFLLVTLYLTACFFIY